jgi:hypothetical protein
MLQTLGVSVSLHKKRSCARFPAPKGGISGFHWFDSVLKLFYLSNF